MLEDKLLRMILDPLYCLRWDYLMTLFQLHTLYVVKGCGKVNFNGD
jgi:hypothetical protein